MNNYHSSGSGYYRAGGKNHDDNKPRRVISPEPRKPETQEV